MRNRFWWWRNLTLFCTDLFSLYHQGNRMINILEKLLWRQWFYKGERKVEGVVQRLGGVKRVCRELVLQCWSLKSKLSHTLQWSYLDHILDISLFLNLFYPILCKWLSYAVSTFQMLETQRQFILILLCDFKQAALVSSAIHIRDLY